MLSQRDGFAHGMAYDRAMVKPLVDLPQVMDLLGEHFGQPVEQFAPVGTGQIASAFAFRVAGQGYIVRFVTGKMAMSFGKDQFIFNKVSSPRIPVPPIIYRGTFNDLHFAISRKFPGVTLDDLSGEDFQQVVPALIETLDSIHQVDVSDTKNFGDFDDTGVGLSTSWPEFLLSVAEEEGEEGFYGKWHHMFDDTFLDRGFFDHIYERMTALLKYCPEDRHLLHADYAFSNVLAEDGKITAVLDWANALYGDFLYDVAWLDLGYQGIDFQSLFQKYYQVRNRDVPHYKERLLCYQCYISLDAQRWYGVAGKREDYDWMRDRILGLLEQSSVG